jgi:hypothetical protein
LRLARTKEKAQPKSRAVRLYSAELNAARGASRAVIVHLASPNTLVTYFGLSTGFNAASTTTTERT